MTKTAKKVYKPIESTVKRAGRTFEDVSKDALGAGDDIARGDFKGAKDRIKKGKLQTKKLVKDNLAGLDDIRRMDFEGATQRALSDKINVVRSNDDPYKRHMGLKENRNVARKKRRGLGLANLRNRNKA